MLDVALVRTLDYSEPSSRDDAVRAAFADGLGDMDFIFSQPARLTLADHHTLRSRYPGKVVTIANFYFRGLFPDSVYVGAFGERVDDPSAMNSLIVLDAFRRGLTESQAVAGFTIDNLHRLGVLSAWDLSMAEMRRREAPDEVDVPSADFIDLSCRRYPAFLTMNHPSAVFLAEYIARAFRVAGLRSIPINASLIDDPLRRHDETPILDAVAEHYGLPYRTSQHWRLNSQGGRWVDRFDYVSHCYRAYERIDPARLLVNSPTDLVEQLQADPGNRFHVSGGAPTPFTAPENLEHDHSAEGEAAATAIRQTDHPPAADEASPMPRVAVLKGAFRRMFASAPAKPVPPPPGADS